MQRSARPFWHSALTSTTRRARIGRVRAIVATLCALMMAATASPAQEPEAGRSIVTGVVKDAVSGAPIPGVVVNIPGTPLQSMTDDQGRYTLRNVPMGNQTIDARRVGYSQVHDVNVRVNAARFVHDMLRKGSLISLPIHGRELFALKLPYYTYGGDLPGSVGATGTSYVTRGVPGNGASKAWLY